MPFYDHDTHLLCLAGRGEYNVSMYELKDGIQPLSTTSLALQTTGLSICLKKVCNAAKVEVLTGFRFTGQVVQQFVVTVPRVSPEYFQDDIFPATTIYSPIKASEWAQGLDPTAILRDMNTSKLPLMSKVPTPAKLKPKFEPRPK